MSRLYRTRPLGPRRRATTTVTPRLPRAEQASCVDSVTLELLPGLTHEWASHVGHRVATVLVATARVQKRERRLREIGKGGEKRFSP